ncbi:hypothetical protein [Actinoplanes philippinensis]|uniref:hypothetical protein n=1 Tax=Actinoplanes philippinensis TaxID=35752 RepID=UPI0033C2C06C
MTVRRMSSRRIALTASFLALAAGGLAACDSAEPEADEAQVPVYTDVYEVEDEVPDQAVADEEDEEDEEEDTDEVFYCADEEGMVVEAEFCADTYPSGTYFLWHSTSFSRGMTPGEYLDDGDYFDANDKASRTAFRLPATGPVANGTVKTGVVGKSATGGGYSTGSSGG